MIAAEALANAAVGLVVSWILTLAVLGYSPGQSAAITAMFFAASFARGLAIRWLFSRLPKRRRRRAP